VSKAKVGIVFSVRAVLL